MDTGQRDALAGLRLTWAPTADDLWHSQGALHVGGLNEFALEEVDAAFADAAEHPDSNPLGVVIRGRAGSGKTHLLGQVRERVQDRGGFFLLVELLDATSFWQSAHGGILDSLNRPGGERETQLKDLLWQLSTLAHVGRADRRSLIGDDDVTPEIVERFVNALHREHRATVRECHHTLRALVLLGSGDLGLQDVGQAFLSGNDLDDAARAAWRLPNPTLTPQESVRQISRIIALAGPAVLAIDQIDTLLAQSTDVTDVAGRTDNRDLEHVAHGLMAIRQTMRRSPAVIACLPAVWESIETRAVGTVSDRFRVTAPLRPLPTAELGRAILERRFSTSYAAKGFTPPYPSWPILPSAFDEAPQFTPRELLKRADAHVRRCLERDTLVELASLTAPDEVPAGEPRSGDTDPTGLDAVFAEYRRRAVPAAALEPDGEDTTVPALLGAVLDAWIAELGEEEQAFRLDPPPGHKPPLHARLRQSLDSSTDDERHWAFRAIAATNAIAAQTRIRNASSAAGSASGSQKRRLFLLRNTPWPSGRKTAELIAEFEAAGGRTLPMTDDDLRTSFALRDMLEDDDAGLTAWLRTRRPAHSVALLRTALGDLAGDEPPPVPVPSVPVQSEPAAAAYPTVAASAHELPLGVDAGESAVTVDLAALRKHTSIFAGSGSGKTVLIRRLIEEAALRGVSSIVLDPNNDLSRLGDPWPQRPDGWNPSDDARAEQYFAGTEVVVWTPRRNSGRPLSFQPLPDFDGVRDSAEEFEDAVDSAVAALEPRALITGNTAKAMQSRAVLKVALRHYARRETQATLPGFIAMLGDLPDGVSELPKGAKLAAELSANLHAAMVNDPLFGGSGTPADPGVLLTPSDGYRARVSVINMIGLTSDQQREGFVNQLQMALFSWIKRNPAADRPLGGLLVMDEAQNFAPSDRYTACTRSTLALVSQARKYGLGLVFATQAPRGLHLHIPGNSTTQFYGLLNAPAQIATAREMARVKGGEVPDISKLRAGNFYVALEGLAFHRIRTPWCLSHHPQSPPTTDEVLEIAQRPLRPRPAP